MEFDSIFKLTQELAVSVIRLYKELIIGKKEFVVSKKILVSATNVGLILGRRRMNPKNFRTNLRLAFSESVRTQYWLEMLKLKDCIDLNTYNSINRINEKIMEGLSGSISCQNKKTAPVKMQFTPAGVCKYRQLQIV